MDDDAVQVDLFDLHVSSQELLVVDVEESPRHLDGGVVTLLVVEDAQVVELDALSRVQDHLAKFELLAGNELLERCDDLGFDRVRAQVACDVDDGADPHADEQEGERATEGDRPERHREGPGRKADSR